MKKRIPGVILILALLLGQGFGKFQEAAVIGTTIKVPKDYIELSTSDINFYQENYLNPTDTKLLFLWSLTAITTGLALIETKTKVKKIKKIDKSVIVPIKKVDYRLFNRL